MGADGNKQVHAEGRAATNRVFAWRSRGATGAGREVRVVVPGAQVASAMAARILVTAHLRGLAP